MTTRIGSETWCPFAELVWRRLEPYHALVYFAPEHRAACDAAGLRGGWMAYFGSRAAPLGPVPPQVVAALFYNFHPSMVARAIPDAWAYATPEAVLQARYSSMHAALARVLAEDVNSTTVLRAAELALAAAGQADTAGHPMFAANLALETPDAPHLALWHAATMLREHRGDGHVIALATSEIDGCQAHVLQVAAGVTPREQLQPNRGWSDDDWGAATDALLERGVLTPDGALTERGNTLRAEVAQQTDWLASAPLRRLGQDRVEQLVDAMQPLVARVRAAGDIPYPNPMGLPEP